MEVLHVEWYYSLTLCAVPPCPLVIAHAQVGEFQLLACTSIVAGIGCTVVYGHCEEHKNSKLIRGVIYSREYKAKFVLPW